MTTSKKGKIGENKVSNMLREHGIKHKFTKRSGATFGDADIKVFFPDEMELHIDSKNESNINKTLNPCIGMTGEMCKDVLFSIVCGFNIEDLIFHDGNEFSNSSYRLCYRLEFDNITNEVIMSLPLKKLEEMREDNHDNESR